MIHLDRPWKQNLRVPMALRWRNGLAKARENFCSVGLTRLVAKSCCATGS